MILIPWREHKQFKEEYMELVLEAMLRKKVYASTYAVYLQQNAVLYTNTKVANNSFDYMTKLKYLGMTLVVQNFVKE
jgi:hypothetical protein